MKSILSNEKRCYICGSPYALHKHHIFRGNKRQVSEDYGCWVYLCVEHHTGRYGVHSNAALDDYLKGKAEDAFIENWSSELFLREFGGKQ